MLQFNPANALWPERNTSRSRVTLFRLLLLCGIAFSVTMQTQAEVENLKLKWSELGAVIEGRKIETVLVDATALEGKAVSVGADHLELEIKETSDATKYPTGPARIPRESLSSLQFTEIRGSWRALGTAIGAGAGAAVGIPTYQYMENEAAGEKGAAIAAGLVGGGAVMGFFAGRSADKRTVVVTIVPD